MAARLYSSALSLALSNARDAAERVTNRFDGRGASADLAYLQAGLTTCMGELAPPGNGLDAGQLAKLADIMETARAELYGALAAPGTRSAMIADTRAIEAAVLAARVAADALRAVEGAVATVGA